MWFFGRRQVLGPIKKVLQEGGVEKEEVDEILLVGGCPGPAGAFTRP